MKKHHAARRQPRFTGKHWGAVLVGGGVIVLFVTVFFAGRNHPKPLEEIAPRIGLRTDEMLAMGPRIASQTGVTLGTSRRVVYLLACSGRATAANLEEQATLAGTLARQRKLSDREAVGAVLAMRGDPVESLKDC